jgi:hypothetical protein
MPRDEYEPEEQLVIIVPVPPEPVEPPYPAWLGPLLIIGVPVALAVLVFGVFFMR